jgi:phytoene dehydrogenase-like protein
VLKDGSEIRANKVASGADANVTFHKLCEEKDLPADFVAGVKGLDYSSASLKINVALSELPNFTSVPGAQAGPQHRGTIHISPDLDYI